MKTKPLLTLHAIIKRAADHTSVYRLWLDIKAVNEDEKTKWTISRPTLTKLYNRSDSVSLTWNNFVALDTYFRKQGLSLMHLPILEARSVLEVLVSAGKIVFMYGAKGRKREQRNDLSWWDHQSFSELLMQTAQLGQHITCEHAPALWRTPATLKSIVSEDWYDVIKKDKASVISIGSPLAALSSEVILAHMFGVNPFEPPPTDSKFPLPFHFMWRPDLAQNFRSAFGVTSRDVQSRFPKLAARNKANRSSAVIVEGKMHESANKKRNWTIYGIIAAQRRAAGNVWLVVAGLAGPATYACSRMVEELVDQLDYTAGKNSGVLWVPVKVTVTTRKARDGDGDVREVVSSVFDGKPRLWTG